MKPTFADILYGRYIEADRFELLREVFNRALASNLNNSAIAARFTKMRDKSDNELADEIQKRIDYEIENKKGGLRRAIWIEVMVELGKSMNSPSFVSNVDLSHVVRYCQTEIDDVVLTDLIEGVVNDRIQRRYGLDLDSYVRREVFSQ
jgi:hypothetical protein